MKWCDLSGEYAFFPRVQAVDGGGSGRTLAALYGARLARLVHKHGPCAGERHTVLRTNGDSQPTMDPQNNSISCSRAAHENRRIGVGVGRKLLLHRG